VVGSSGSGKAEGDRGLSRAQPVTTRESLDHEAVLFTIFTTLPSQCLKESQHAKVSFDRDTMTTENMTYIRPPKYSTERSRKPGVRLKVEGQMG